jgi:transposase-like protein
MERCPFCGSDHAEVFDKIYMDCPDCNRVWEAEYTEKLREKYQEKYKYDD